MLKAKTFSECAPILYDWLMFFRKGHLGIKPNDTLEQASFQKYLDHIYDTEKPIIVKKGDESKYAEYIKTLDSKQPYIKQLNKTTLYIRIPSFNQKYKEAVDSIFITQRETILATKNLIIDIRENGGGSDDTYSTIIPYLYTNPIRIVGVEFFSTKLNNQRMLDFINKPNTFLMRREKNGQSNHMINCKKNWVSSSI